MRRTIESVAAEYMTVDEIGPLISVLARQEGFVTQVAREALVRLLPALRSRDSDLLSRQNHEWMHNKLWRDLNDPFADYGLGTAILSALRQIGTPAAVPIVERLAEYAPQHVMREAARACLPDLRVRAARLRNEQTLLRPSEPREDSETVLLRPASGAGGESGVLLRSIDESGI